MNNIFNYYGDLKFKGYYDSFIDILKDLADEKSQIKAWKNGIYNFGIVEYMGNKNHIYFYAFSELCSSFLEDCKTIFTLYREVGFSKEQFEMIKKLYDMIENYDSTTGKRDEKGDVIGKTDAQIANDPKWHEIRNYAKHVYKELVGECL
ncbi:MAG: hypothetical protein KFB93_00140 [Simkaniaceae bacterium]|nr:MAG: hypothetical protein KFB93_00140 [Simkaniaceae bacterium]